MNTELNNTNTESNDKLTWSISEASEMTGIGTKTLREIFKKPEADTWRLVIGKNKFLIKVTPFMSWFEDVKEI